MLILMVVFSFSNVAYAASNDAEVVASFKQYVKEEVAKALATYKEGEYQVNQYEHSTYSGREGKKIDIIWRKYRQELNSQYNLDLKKTDSLISPYVGKVSISKNYYIYHDFPTKLEAEKDTEYMESITDYKFTVAYQDDQWVVIKVQVDNMETDPLSIYEILQYK